MTDSDRSDMMSSMDRWIDGWEGTGTWAAYSIGSLLDHTMKCTTGELPIVYATMINWKQRTDHNGTDS